MSEYFSAVVVHLWAIFVGIVAGILWLVGLVLGKNREERVLYWLKSIAGIVAFVCLSLAQALAWVDAKEALTAESAKAASLTKQIDRMNLSFERERGELVARIARLEGRLDTTDDQRAEARSFFDQERSRSEALQDELRDLAVDLAKKPVQIEQWTESSIRFAGSRQILPPPGESWNGLQLVFHTGEPRSSVAIAITCTCVLERIDASYSTIPTGIYIRSEGLSESKHEAWFKIEDPPFLPESSLLVRVFSKEIINITNIRLIEE